MFQSVENIKLLLLQSAIQFSNRNYATIYKCRFLAVNFIRIISIVILKLKLSVLYICVF